MKRYEVTGIPLGTPFSVLDGRRVGEQFEADLDPDIEHILVGVGALVEVKDAPAVKQTAAAKADEPDEPDEGTRRAPKAKAKPRR
jgi:hypothetical protein